MKTTTYGYRADCQLETVKVGSSAQVAFTYDLLGRKTRMEVGSSSVRQYDYDGDSVLMERTWDETNPTVNLRSYLPGVSVTDETNPYLPASYYHGDAHGSNRMMTDSSGFSYANEDFDAWGKTVAYNGGGVGTYGYAGDWGYRKDQYVDSANTGSLIQCGVRHYDPDLGRFLQMDRLLGYTGRTQSLNRYIYCESDPANRADSLGMDSGLDQLGTGGKIGAGAVALIAGGTAIKAVWGASAISGACIGTGGIVLAVVAFFVICIGAYELGEAIAESGAEENGWMDKFFNWWYGDPYGRNPKPHRHRRNRGIL